MSESPLQSVPNSEQSTPERTPLTNKEFANIPEGVGFKTGFTTNEDAGMPFGNKTKDTKLFWVAKKGRADDWAIYVLPYLSGNTTVSQVMRIGTKIMGRTNIVRLIAVDYVVLAKYRK